jgi:hypothetical protein
LIFDRGIRYAEHLLFGAVFLEFGSRLHWLGYRIRCLDSTYVVHHSDPALISFKQPEIHLSARFFAMLCHSFIYQPILRNKLLCCIEILKETLIQQRVGLLSLRAGLHAYREQANLVTANPRHLRHQASEPGGRPRSRPCGS